MSAGDDLLEVLQADVFGVLQSTPALALANVLLNNEGDTDSKIENAIKTLTLTGGKRGLAIVVLRPEVTEGEKGLPGPPLTLKIEIQCIEQVLMNRGADGTQVRSSQAALNVLAALHHRHLGHCLLYADKDPIQPVQVKTGFVSDSVTIFSKFSGLVLPKPLGVEPTMAARSTISIAGTSGANGILLADENPIDGYDGYNSPNGAVIQAAWSPLDEKWLIISPTYQAEKASIATSPIGLTGWTIITGTGQPVITAGPATDVLTLQTTAPDSLIRYTTNGSFPGSSGTIYTGPMTGLATGTVVRAAAHVVALGISDVLEFTITA